MVRSRMLKPLLICSDELVIAIKRKESKGKAVRRSQMSTDHRHTVQNLTPITRIIYTQQAATQGVFIVNSYSFSDNTIFTLDLNDSLKVYRDRNLHADAVAIAHKSARLLFPKHLQLMPYLRAWQESFLIMIPWLGFAISVLMLISMSLLKTGKKHSKNNKKLKFTFSLGFYLSSSLLTLYPILLTFLDKSACIVWFAPGIFLLLMAFNLLATKHRNNRVSQYNQSILEAVTASLVSKSTVGEGYDLTS